MIESWQISNFKSISSMENPLSLSPLTVLTGTNSSGKSTFLQSILMVAQTMKNSDLSIPLILNGDYVKLGDFKSLLNASLKTDNTDNKDKIELKISLKDPVRGPDGKNNTEIWNAIFQFGLIENNFFPDILSFKLSNGDKEFSMIYENGSCNLPEEEWEKYYLDRYYRYSDSDPLLVSFDLKRGFNYYNKLFSYKIKCLPDMHTKENKIFKNQELFGCLMNHCLPDKLVYKIDKVEEYIDRVCEALIGQVPSALNFDNQESSLGYYDLYMNYDYYIKKSCLGFQESIVEFMLDILIKLDLNCFDKFEKLVTDHNENNIETLFFNEWFDFLNSIAEKEKQCILNEFKIIDLDTKIRNIIIKSEYDIFYLEADDDNITGKDTYWKHQPEKFRKNLTPLNRLFTADIPMPFRAIIKKLDAILSSPLKYLGSLRSEPKTIYPYIETNNVGIKGENTAVVMFINKNSKIKYLPADDSFIKPLSLKPLWDDRLYITKEQTTVYLSDAINDWAKYLNIADSINVKYIGKYGLEIVINNGDDERYFDITNVGTGVSQLLPIIVMGLSATKGSVLIFDQPEMYLHPKIQSRLADFFVSLALVDKQCIVETHSEYLIDRLRYLTVRDKSGKIRDTVCIYFIEKNKKGNSKFKKIDINKYGVLSEWPKDFFDESQKISDKILYESLKRQEEEGDEKND